MLTLGVFLNFATHVLPGKHALDWKIMKIYGNLSKYIYFTHFSNPKHACQEAHVLQNSKRHLRLACIFTILGSAIIECKITTFELSAPKIYNASRG